jgi:hypothetical protein
MSKINMSDLREKNEPGSDKGSFRPDGSVDLERRGSTTVHGRKMSRIGPPPKPGSLSLPDTSGSDDEYGKLVAMEADNAIKYRTCSWQKVGFPKGILLRLLTSQTDRGSTVLRVHLLGDHVVPLFIFNSRPCTWPYPYSGSSRVRSLHISRCLGIVSPPRNPESVYLDLAAFGGPVLFLMLMNVQLSPPP